MNAPNRFKTCLLALALAGAAHSALAADVASDTALPKGQVALVVDAKEYVTRINNTVEMALRGEYGTLRPGSESKLRSSQDKISRLLHGRTTTTELQGEDRIALVNAEEAIKSVIRNDDKSRMVCTRSPGTGSRLAKKECMTVAEREARAAEARRLVSEQTRSNWGGVAQ